ncbi:hypothetical protein SteCoe_5656 [Stentor coeruleus]|uniref:Uncharacterized protein n=1 Tax=Stentor coeruleus TaxID=5963 RepID=A0A1R2CRZ9_9CILI|nr:hypothetical protein SteCoe_5656 [Stentor coeruleus]
MNLGELLELTEIHKDMNALIKCDFRDIQKSFAILQERYMRICQYKHDTPTKSIPITRTPSTNFSTPKTTPKRKLKLTPQKSSKSSRKSSNNSEIDPENIFGRPLKVNLHDIFQDYVSSSDEGKLSFN